MNAKLITAASMLLAGCGFIAGQSVEPTAERRSSPGSEPPAVTRNSPATAPVETPLVEKLLPKEEPTGPQDGDLSAGGNFAYESARNAWIPVDKGQTWHLHNKRRPTAEHLIATHGHARSSVEKWTQREIEICHANDHAQEYTAKQAAAQDCRLNGTCGNPNVSRGLFRRR